MELIISVKQTGGFIDFKVWVKRKVFDFNLHFTLNFANNLNFQINYLSSQRYL